MERVASVHEDRAGRYILTLTQDEKRKYTVPPCEYHDLGSPRAGDMLPPEDVERIALADEQVRAEATALRILGAGDNSAYALRRKLAEHGFGKAARDAVTEGLIARGLLNEERQLRQAIRAYAEGKYWGPRKILPALAAKGYPTALARAILDEMTEGGEVDFRATARALLRRRLPEGASAEEKRALLLRFGYSPKRS